jgi:5-methylthioadenosine/S-adenosylhomocysteine deaminase
MPLAVYEGGARHVHELQGGRPEDHVGSERRSSRRDFLKASAATGAAARLTLFNTSDASARDKDDDNDAPQDHGRPGRRYLIRGGHVMSMDPRA